MQRSHNRTHQYQIQLNQYLLNQSIRINQAPLKRIIQEAGAERVSADAVDALVAYLEADADAVAKKAIEYAKIAKRQTVKAEDIALATGVTTTSDTPAENEHNLFDVIKKVIESAEEGKGFEEIIKSFIKFDKK